MKRVNILWFFWLKNGSWTLIPTLKIDRYEIAFRFLKIKIAYQYYDIDDSEHSF